MNITKADIEAKIHDCERNSYRCVYFTLALTMLEKASECQDAQAKRMFSRAVREYYESADLRIGSSYGRLCELAGKCYESLSTLCVYSDVNSELNEDLDPKSPATQVKLLLNIIDICEKSFAGTEFVETTTKRICLTSALESIELINATNNQALKGIRIQDYKAKIRAFVEMSQGHGETARQCWSRYSGNSASRAFECAAGANIKYPDNSEVYLKFLEAGEAFLKGYVETANMLIEEGHRLAGNIDKRPSLVMFGGPNGSGKSTLTNAIRGGVACDAVSQLIGNTLLGCKYINTDEITGCLTRIIAFDVEAKLDESNPSFAKFNKYAADMTADMRDYCLEKGTSFAFETVMSMGDKVAFLDSAHKKGFATTLVFVSTSDVSINIERVAIRRSEGGHDVPAKKIQERYVRTMKWIVFGCLIADTTYLYDNSNVGRHPVYCATIAKGQVVDQREDSPEWILKIISEVESLRNTGNVAEQLILRALNEQDKR